MPRTILLLALALTPVAPVFADTVFWDSGAVWENVAVLQVTSGTPSMVLVRRGEQEEPVWFQGFSSVVIAPCPTVPREAPPAAPAAARPQDPAQPPESFEQPQPPQASALTYNELRARMLERDDRGSRRWIDDWNNHYRGVLVRWSGTVLRERRAPGGEGIELELQEVAYAPRPFDEMATEPGMMTQPDMLLHLPEVTRLSDLGLASGSTLVYLAELGEAPRRAGPLPLRGLDVVPTGF